MIEDAYKTKNANEVVQAIATLLAFAQ